MKHKLFAITIVLFMILVGSVAFAGDYPKVEIFGGYQYGRSFDEATKTLNLQVSNGWRGQLSANANQWFGVVTAVAGVYSTGNILGIVSVPAKAYILGVGPEFSARSKKVRFFTHAILGLDRSSVKATVLGVTLTSASANAFMIAPEAGFDININKIIAVRPVQVGTIIAIKDGSHTSFALSSGLVIKLGH